MHRQKASDAFEGPVYDAEAGPALQLPPRRMLRALVRVWADGGLGLGLVIVENREGRLRGGVFGAHR